MTRHKRVALITPANIPGHEILKGAQQYLLQNGSLDPFVCVTEAEISTVDKKRISSLFKTIKPDGVVAMVTPGSEKLFQTCGRPVVNVSDVTPCDLPTVIADNVMMGRLAGRHLLQRGLQHFAYGFASKGYFARQRWEGFQAELAEAGMSADLFDDRCPGGRKGIIEDSQLRDLLAGLPKPAGVFMCYGELALQVIWACQEIGLKVPADVAVLGGQDYENQYTMWVPSLSSISLPSWQIGFEAIRLLEKLMDGGLAPDGPVLIQPTGVIARQSTNLLAFPDAEVAAALEFIRHNAHRPVGVKHVLERVPLSRRTLDRRFLKVVGHSLHREIARVHIERAKTLLAGGDQSVADVATAAGFSSNVIFSAAFKQQVGMTPTQYRRQARRQ